MSTPWHKPLSAKKWAELKDGWGLTEVPKELRKEFICCMCGRDWPGTKLYVNGPALRYTNLREYQEALSGIRNHCYCRYHAEQMFKD